MQNLFRVCFDDLFYNLKIAFTCPNSDQILTYFMFKVCFKKEKCVFWNIHYRSMRKGIHINPTSDFNSHCSEERKEMDLEIISCYWPRDLVSHSFPLICYKILKKIAFFVHKQNKTTSAEINNIYFMSGSKVAILLIIPLTTFILTAWCDVWDSQKASKASKAQRKNNTSQKLLT